MLLPDYRAFSIAGPRLLNDLPLAIRYAPIFFNEEEALYC